MEEFEFDLARYYVTDDGDEYQELTTWRTTDTPDHPYAMQLDEELLPPEADPLWFWIPVIIANPAFDVGDPIVLDNFYDIPLAPGNVASTEAAYLAQVAERSLPIGEHPEVIADGAAGLADAQSDWDDRQAALMSGAHPMDATQAEAVLGPRPT